MGKAIAITRSERSATELRDQAVKTEDGAVVRRLLGIALVLEGHSREAAATAVGMDRHRCATGSTAITRAVWPA